MPSPEVEQLQQQVDSLEQAVGSLKDEIKKLKEQNDESRLLKFIQDRLRLAEPNYRPSSITAGKIALTPKVATVTAVAGYTELFDNNGNSLKIAVLT